MLPTALPAPDFELLFAALPAPHAVLAPNGTVLAVNAALAALLPAGPAAGPGQSFTALRAALAVAGHTLAAPAAWTAGLRAAANTLAAQVLPPGLAQARDASEPNPGTRAPTHWEATLQPVCEPAGELRYVLLGLLDVGAELRTPADAPRRLHQILGQAPALIATLEWPDHRYTFTNPGYDELAGHRARLGRPAAECFPEAVEQGFLELLDTVYRTGEPFVSREAPMEFRHPVTHEGRLVYLDINYQPLRDEQGQTTGILAFAVDATERVLARQAAEALRTARDADAARLRQQVAALPLIIFSTDAQGHTTYTSPQWYAYTGQPPGGPWAEVDTAWADALHPDDRARAQHAIQQSVDHATVCRVEVRLRGADGRYRWFLTEAVPEFDAAGQLLCRHGFMLDLHELRDAQRRLEEKDQQLSQILAHAPALIATLAGPDHRYTYFNPGYDAALNGRIRLGQPLVELLPEAVEQGFCDLLDHVYRTGETYQGVEMSLRLRDTPADALPSYYDFTYLALRDGMGAVAGILVFAFDVSERVRARQQAEALATVVDQRDEQVRTITAAVPVFIFNFDPSGHITYTNPYFYEYTGLDATGSPDDAWLTLPPDDRAAAGHVGQAAMAAGEAWQATFRCRRRDGALRWFQTTAQPYANAAGQLAGFSAATIEIHELHARTEELAGSRADFAALADNIAQLAWMADADGHIFWYNQQWYDYTGSTPKEMQGFGWQRAQDPALVAGVNERYLACIRSGQDWEDTFPLRGHDGQYRWFLSRARPIRDAATGAVARWFGTNTDITEQRRLQQQLAESEEELRIQAESIPQQVWTAQPDGTVDFYNQRTAAYLGESMEENSAANWLESLHPDDRLTAQNSWVEAQADQRYYEAEFRLRRYDGEYRWFLAQAQARRAPTGQVLKWYGTNTDVHQQHQLREQVLASQARFQQMLETLPQMAWTARADGSINYYNQRWYDFTGSNFAELRDWGWEQFIHPADYPGTLHRWQHSIATGEPFEDEHRWRDQQGHYRWFLARAEAIRDQAGQVVGWVGANTNVNEFKEAQAQLEAQNARLVRTNQDLDSFVYTASHDLKQPIHNMAGIFEELTRTAYFRDPDAIKLIAFFERALSQIFATIDDLSTIVQGQRQQQELPAEAVPLAPLVADVIASLQEEVRQAEATFEFDFATCPTVTFVRTNLHSLFFNLISNSLRYAAPARPARIVLSAAADLITGRPILTVQDNGLGIDLERFGTQLFQLFRRFHTHVEGTGMGLYLVNRIVQNQGGRLEVSSVVDEGTTFRVYL